MVARSTLYGGNAAYICCCFGVCGVRARNPAALSSDVVFADSISAQPATKSVAAATAKMRMTCGLGFSIFIFVFALAVGCELELALGDADNITRYFFAI